MAKQRTVVDLPPGTVVFSNLTKPRAWSEGAEPRYDITVAWPAVEFDAKGGEWHDIKKAIHETAVDAWGDRANKRQDGGPPYKVPFNRGEDREDPEQFAGYVLATFRSKWPVPCVRLAVDGPPAKIDPSEIERGMGVSVAVIPNAYVTSFRGVSLYAYAVALERATVDEEFIERTQSQGAKKALTHFDKRRAKADEAYTRHADEEAERSAQDTVREADEYRAAKEGDAPPARQPDDEDDGGDIPF